MAALPQDLNSITGVPADIDIMHLPEGDYISGESMSMLLGYKSRSSASIASKHFMKHIRYIEVLIRMRMIG